MQDADEDAKVGIFEDKMVTFFSQANVMLEYSLDDAQALLQRNLEAAKKSLEQVEEDLGFIRDQTTTIEVSILAPCNVRLLCTW